MEEEITDEDLPSPMGDLDDDGFIQLPASAITTNDLVVKLETEDYITYTYTRCDNCILAQFGCKLYREHGSCQIERNLFREHLKDLRDEGVNVRDKMMVMLSFLQLKGAWRTGAKLAVFDERAEFQGNKEAIQLLKSNHKTLTDYTKEFIRIQKELLSTPKERKSKTAKKADTESFSALLVKIRRELDEEEEDD
jgi:hypothetical protein